MNDSFGGDLNATQTTVGAASEQKPEGIAPVLVKQILESSEGNFQLFDLTFGMVVTATIVRSIETSSTKVTYLLEDYTGRIEGHYWLDEGDSSNIPDVILNNYAKVYGSIRNQGGKKTLMIFRMFPILDPNELNTHLLEVLNTRFKAEEFSKNGGTNAEFSMGNGANSKSVFGSVGGDNLGLEGKQLAIFQAIRSFVSEEGISRNQLQSKFTHVKKDELSSILDFLSSEGHIYSSVDPDHFVCTEM